MLHKKEWTSPGLVDPVDGLGNEADLNDIGDPSASGFIIQSIDHFIPGIFSHEANGNNLTVIYDKNGNIID